MTRKLQLTYDGDVPVPNELSILEPGMVRPDEVKDGDNYSRKFIVRVWDSWNGWCCYSGPTTWTDIQVAEYGDEVAYELAIKIFPTFAHIKRSYGGT